MNILQLCIRVIQNNNNNKSINRNLIKGERVRDAQIGIKGEKTGA